MTRTKSIEVEVYDCPDCGTELLLKRMEREGQRCPTCEDIQERKETQEDYAWMIGATVSSVDSRVGDPRQLGLVDFEALDGQKYRLWVGWSARWSFMGDDEEGD